MPVLIGYKLYGVQLFILPELMEISCQTANQGIYKINKVYKLAH